MSHFESTLFDSLKTLVSNRVYPDVAPDQTDRPYITYQQVGGQPVNFVDATVPSKKNGRFQINVWSETRLETATLARQVEDTLRVVASLQVTVLGEPISVYELDTLLYGTHQDFSLWF